ncbi:hypothetical protein ABZY68_25620 [Streptomyces sp. NPDC006482]|uniref:hypothetical protein n=1 Tax=Streptomyces sp. NPDC006482 TaxID=3154306 RepID=UPI0033BB1AB1
MGRPGILKKPQIDVGPLKVLNDSLHELHLQVGRPSLPKISEKSGKQTDGYLATTTIKYVMSEPRLPNFQIMQRLVAVLVEFAPAGLMDLDETTKGFIEKWQAAAKAEDNPPPNPHVQELRDTGNAYLKLADAYQRAWRMAGSVFSERTVANEWAYVAELSAELLGDNHPATVEARERAGADAH